MTSRALARALAGAGLQLSGPLGTGSGGDRPAARDRDGNGWAVTVIGPQALSRDRLRARVAALAEVHHPHVARVAPLLELRDGTGVALQAEVLGPDLATVASARGRWRPGEVVTLVVPLAEALAALHDAGVVHGDVAPGNVVLEPGGRPVLVDLVCGAGADELGTPGLAAPERARGATAAADVYALGRLGLALLDGGSDVDAVPQAALDGRPPQAGDEPGAARLRAVLERATAADPAARPDPGALAELVYAACDPEPIALPDAAVLARLTLRRLAEPTAYGATVVRTGPGSRGHGRHRQPPAGRRPAAVGVLAAVVVVVLATVGLVALVPRLTAAASPDPGPAPVTAPGTAPRGSGPVAAAARLTVRRAHALGSRDPVALASVTVPGSEAEATDRLLAARLWRHAPSGGGAEIEEARLLAVAGPRPGRPAQARVLVRARAWVSTQQTSRTGEPRTGAERGDRSADAVVLVLEATGGTWRVSSVEPATAG